MPPLQLLLLLSLMMMNGCWMLDGVAMGDESAEKNGKFLSLFTVVNFPNDPCIASTTRNGTCMSTAECASKGGTSGNSCAQGFGICCIITKSACGSTIDQNCTYIESPSTINSGNCIYYLKKCEDLICQFRLDYDVLTLASPSTTGVCSTDSLTISTQSGANPPVICGYNTGQHMYLPEGELTTLNFQIGTATATRGWRVKVSQIRCDTTYRADNGCLQYLTGSSGSVCSFNTASSSGSNQVLQNQNYRVCVRMELYMCTIEWTDSIFALGSTDPCTAAGSDFVLFDTTGRQCDDSFSDVTSTVKPFGFDMASDTATGTAAGFCLNYQQKSC